ncbi:MAG: S8 family serine peptidase, partial [Acidobacteriota bacterium]|nr:S8 family serine peptidase [Acidobacteriota bacterium]
IQRGTISFADKVLNAMNAGAAEVVIYNNVVGDFAGTLGAATTSDGRAWIPAVTVSDKIGATLKGQIGWLATVVNKTSDWDHYDGTSMATPHVSGVLALIWSVNSGLSNSTVESYLFNTATDLGAAGYDTTYGRGIVNADAAVTQAQGGGGGTPSAPNAPSNLNATAVSKSQINLAWTDNSNNEDGFKIERSTSSGSGFTQIATVEAGVRAYSSTGLTRNKTYYYRVRAYNAGGNSFYSNTASAKTPSR